MKLRALVLGAGFGGLELTTRVSEALGDQVELTLIDQADSFVFGYSKLDVMFGRETPNAVRVPYRHIVKPGVRFRQETITSIEPATRRVTTNRGTYEADKLVVALGADYDVTATPGLSEAGTEYYSVAGAQRMREILPTFTKGHALVGVCGAPFKCPPAPSETALLLSDYLTERGIRKACEISLVLPFPVPIPPSPSTSKALLAAYAEKGIRFFPSHTIRALEPARHVAILDDGSELPCDLLLGIPKHRAPRVVAESGMTEDGWVPVDERTLATRFDGVYAIGDVTDIDVPKAGVFAESAARVVAAGLIAELGGGSGPGPYDGSGSCYIEFGSGRVGRADMNFLSGPTPTGTLAGPSTALAREKRQFGATRRTRWFGL